MSAWNVLSAAGFYPVTPGSPFYAIGSPLFPEVRFNLENGRSFAIKAHGVSETNIYIQSATLNGQPYHKSYLAHRDLMAGGELLLQMGSQPNTRWGARDRDVPVSRITGQEIVPVPVIKAAGQTFKDRLAIGMQVMQKGMNVFYTTDGSEPNQRSRRFTKAFFIDRTSTVKAIAVGRRGTKSLVATAHYHKISHNWTITLLSKYSLQYSGGGDLALIDGIRGTTNLSGGAWQGYQGQDFVAVIDLGKVQNISRLGAGFLQDVGAWIWMPRRVDFEVSIDGRDFAPAVSISNDVPDGSNPGLGIGGAITKDFVRTIEHQQARYIRIRAQNFGKIPSWHAGSGGDPWIFVDEITID